MTSAQIPDEVVERIRPGDGRNRTLQNRRAGVVEILQASLDSPAFLDHAIQVAIERGLLRPFPINRATVDNNKHGKVNVNNVGPMAYYTIEGATE